MSNGEGFERDRCVIIGAGPAGLTAAYELSKSGIPAVVFEQDEVVGGIARTVNYKGYLFDIGGHRFFTKIDFVHKLWVEILGKDFITRPRLSRIYYADKFFDYPLRPLNAFLQLGPLESLHVLLSYIRAHLFPSREEQNFEQWVSNRFGRRLYEIFFKTYTEKVWGITCNKISADWAAQRIKNLDLFTALVNAFLSPPANRKGLTTTLIDQFHYPRLGPGMMWERCREILAEKGYQTVTGAEVTGVHHKNGEVVSVTIRDRSGNEREEPGAHFLCSMPISSLVHVLYPAPPDEVLKAADELRHRDFLTVVLIVDRPDLFPDNWIYIHSPKVRLGRVQNFKNWSPDMVPDRCKSSLGLEYFVQENDELWNASDKELIELGRRECASIGLINESEVIDGTVVRMRKAYPVYTEGYKGALDVIRSYLEKLPNLQLIGRNGQHRYNNQDHSMVTAIYAARNIVGSKFDVWDVNVDGEYHEESRKSDLRPRERLVAVRVDRKLDAELIKSIFAYYDPVALGVSVGIVFGVGLFLATAMLLIQGSQPVGATLSLLRHYLPGYSVLWGGAFLGLGEAGLGGFMFGFALAKGINIVVAWHEASLRRRLELLHFLDPLDEQPT